MKKFSSMLALGLAAAMTFGMTVCAAPSVSTTDSDVTNDTLQEAAASVVVKNESVKEVEAITVEVFDQAAAAAADVAAKATENIDSNPVIKEAIAEVLGVPAAEVTSADVTLTPLKGFDAKAEEGAKFPLTVTFEKVTGVSGGNSYVVLHQLPDGTWETLKAAANGSSLTVTFPSSLSPVVPVKVEKPVKAGIADDDEDEEPAAAVTADGKVAAPKTGETLPMAGVVTVICLAGAALCVKKIRYNY